MKKITLLFVTLLAFASLALNAQVARTLIWNPSTTTAIDGYKIYQATGFNSAVFSRIATLNGLMLPLTNLQSGNFYAWYGTAYKGTNESDRSNVATLDLRTNTVPVPVPTNIVVVPPYIYLVDFAPLVANPSFELSTNSWAITGNVMIRWYNFTSGTNALGFNVGQLTPNGVVSQTINTIVGSKYFLTFDLGIIGKVANQSARVVVQGTANNATKDIVLSNSIVDYVKATFYPQRIMFTADNTRTKITFYDTSATSDAIDMLLDTVKVSRVISE
jgi:major type 1 subunit fimbrin (pilin)